MVGFLSDCLAGFLIFCLSICLYVCRFACLSIFTLNYFRLLMCCPGLRGMMWRHVFSLLLVLSLQVLISHQTPFNFAQPYTKVHSFDRIKFGYTPDELEHFRAGTVGESFIDE